MRRPVLLGLLLWQILAGPGCSRAIFSVVTFRREAPLAAGALARLDTTSGERHLTKRDVLADLGPPLTVIGQARGDIFVYRRQAADANTINLNPAFFLSGSPPVSLYYDSDESYRDDVLMIFFDEQGEVQGHALSEGSRQVGASRAARVGESLQEILR